MPGSNPDRSTTLFQSRFVRRQRIAQISAECGQVPKQVTIGPPAAD